MSAPTEPGLYWAAPADRDGMKWWPYIVLVEGEAPFLYVASCWDRCGISTVSESKPVLFTARGSLFVFGPKIEPPTEPPTGAKR